MRPCGAATRTVAIVEPVARQADCVEKRVLGHEIGHGYDDQGSQFDATGTLRNWWQDSDREGFEAYAARMAEYIEAYCPVDSPEGPVCLRGCAPSRPALARRAGPPPRQGLVGLLPGSPEARPGRPRRRP